MVKIRLRRMGHRSRPTYRVVAIDSRRARNGEYLESVGSYDPRTKELHLKSDRVDFWLARGAQPSDTVGRLIRRWSKQHAPVAPPPGAASPVAVEEAQAPTATPHDSPQDANQGVSHEGTD